MLQVDPAKSTLRQHYCSSVAQVCLVSVDYTLTNLTLSLHMTDWDSPAVILSEYCVSLIHAKDLSSETYLYASAAYVNVVHVLFGLYM
jgi:hypothetical protein